MNRRLTDRGAPSSLTSFIELLELHGEISTINCPVSTLLEMAAICRKVSRSPGGDSALLFRQPEGFSTPVAANLFGSLKRNCLAVGAGSMAELGLSFEELLPEGAVSDLETLSCFLKNSRALQRYAPLVTEAAPLYENELQEGNLLKLPFLQNWPDDGKMAGTGRYITLGQVASTDPEGGSTNYGIYRCQIHDRDRLAIRWSATSGAARHYNLFRQQKKCMPIAILLGGPPTLTLSSAWPLPDGVNELIFAGWMAGRTIPVAKCRESAITVPAEGEIVIEALVLPDQPIMEGPFGNHTGQYDHAALTVQARVVRICHRSSAILPATLVGPPPQEDCFMMAGWERLLEVMLTRLVPGVKKIHLPTAWLFKGGAVISIDNSLGRKAVEIAEALWQLPWFRNSRLLLMVDQHIMPDDLLKVAWRLINQAEWQNGLITDCTGGRFAIDATRPGNPVLSDLPETEALIKQRWKEYGLPWPQS